MIKLKLVFVSIESSDKSQSVGTITLISWNSNLFLICLKIHCSLKFFNYSRFRIFVLSQHHFNERESFFLNKYHGF